MFGRLGFRDLLFAAFLGVATGVYIYKPIFGQFAWEQKNLKTDSDAAEKVEKPT